MHNVEEATMASDVGELTAHVSREEGKERERERERKGRAGLNFGNLCSIHPLHNEFKYSAFNFRVDLLFLNELVRCVE